MEIFSIFGVALEAEGAPFWLKKASFVRSDFLMLSGANGTGGRRHGGGPWKEQKLAKKEEF